KSAAARRHREPARGGPYSRIDEERKERRLPMSLRGTIFDLSDRVAIITGGAGLLGPKHAEAIASAGGIPVIVDLAIERAQRVAAEVKKQSGVDAMAAATDITR